MIIPKLWALKYGSDERSHLTHDIFAKFYWLIHDVLPLSFTYWRTFPSKITTFVSIGIIFLACLIQYIFKHKEETVKNSLYKILICIGLVLLSFAPNLIVFESIANHRIVIAIQTIMFLFIAFSVLTLIKIIGQKFQKTIFVIIAIPIIIWASWTTNFAVGHYYAYPLHAEYIYLRNQFLEKQKIIESKQKIYLITAQLPFLTKREWADEYGMPSSFWKDDLLCYATALALELDMKVNFKDVLLNKKFIIKSNKADVPKNSPVVDINMIHQKIKN